MASPVTPISADRFRSLVDRLGVIVWEAVAATEGGEARFTFVSSGAEALLGHPSRRWLEESRFWLTLVHPDDRAHVLEQVGGAIRERRNADFEYRALAADGRELWLRNIVQADVAPGGATELRGVVVDVTARHIAAERLASVQDLMDALSGVLDAREVAAVAAERGREAVRAAAVAVFVRVGDDELEISGYDGFSDVPADEICRVPLDRDIPAAEAVRTGRPIILEADALDARYPSVRDWQRLAGRGLFLALPLLFEGESLGALAIRMPDGRWLDRDDRVVLEVVARTCAHALRRAHLVAAEREATTVLDAIVSSAPEGFGLFDTDLRYVRVNEALAAINGVPAAEHVGRTMEEVLPAIPAEGRDAPLRRVLATREPVVDLEVTGRTAADPEREHHWLVSYYPILGARDEVAWLGAFVVDITERKRAERRNAALARLGPILDEVVGVEARLSRLVDTIVPDVADVCAVSLRRPDGTLERVAVRHVDPGLERRLATEDPQAPSAVEVPLVVRGRDLGRLFVGSLRAGAFGPDDVQFVEEIARRSALAADNAQLYERERLALDRSRRQYAVAAALAQAMTPADVARAVLREVLPAVGASRGTVWQLAADGAAVEIIGHLGFDADAVAAFARIPLAAHRPTTDVVRDGLALWSESAAEMEASYAGLGTSLREAGAEAVAVLPLPSAGRAIGAMFLSSDQPRAWSDDDRDLATALAAQAGQALERARLYETERAVSVTLQRSLLPAALPQRADLEVAVRYLPAAGLEAGGDFYEAVELADGSISLAVGDVVGRGASAAATMGQLRSALRAFALAGGGPAAVLERLSDFADTVGGAMAATAVAARLRPDTGELRYAVAGHPWPLLVHADGSAEYLAGGRGVPLACLREPGYEEAVAHLRPGSTLLLYTDGLTERRGLPVDRVLERLRTVAVAANGAPLAELLDRAIAETGEAEPADDVALVAVRMAAPATEVRRLRFVAEPAQVPAARATLRAWLADLGAGRAASADVLLAAGEAVANAVEHSGSAEVELELTVPGPGVLALTVSDRGRWREPAAETDRGRGFGLMRALADEVEVEGGADGTAVRLRHHLGTGEPAPAAPAAPTAPGACAVRMDGRVAVVTGELDLAAAAGVRDRLLAAAPEAIDVSGVAYLDSAGARVLLETAERLPRRPAIVAPPGSTARRALELSGLGAVLDLRDA